MILQGDCLWDTGYLENSLLCPVIFQSMRHKSISLNKCIVYDDRIFVLTEKIWLVLSLIHQSSHCNICSLPWIPAESFSKRLTIFQQLSLLQTSHCNQPVFWDKWAAERKKATVFCLWKWISKEDASHTHTANCRVISLHSPSKW